MDLWDFDDLSWMDTSGQTIPNLNAYSAWDNDGQVGATTQIDFGDEPVAATLKFQFNRLDSWDGEAFFLDLDGERIELGQFYHGRSGTDDTGTSGTTPDGSVSWLVTEMSSGQADGSNGRWDDAVHRVEIALSAVSGETEIGFGSTLDQRARDESWSIQDGSIEIQNDGATFTLVDASTNEVLADLTDGAEIDAALVEGRNVSVLAEHANGDVESVRMSLNDTLERVENVAPYALFGDKDGALKSSATLVDGTHTVSAAFFSGDRASGTLIDAATVSFTIGDQHADGVLDANVRPGDDAPGDDPADMDMGSDAGQMAKPGDALLWSEHFGQTGPRDALVIMAGQHVVLDVPDVDVQSILIMGGTLEIGDTQDSQLAAEWILVVGGGTFQVGTADDPFEHNFTLELTGDNPARDINLRRFGMDMTIENNDAFLMAMGDGSAIEMHAADRAKQSWTQLATTAEVGDTVLRFTEATNWEVGDLIAIASSDFEHDHHETRVITDVRNNGRVIEIDSPLDHRHYGEIETYDNDKRGTAFQSWDVDLRAEVGLLSRNITVTGDEDAQDDLFGGHTMVMEGAEMRIDGVEFTKMGQAAILGRYATHWHMLDDASGQYIQNASYHQTFNKGMTIHGTDNVTVHNNVLFDHIGHGVFFEDGSETGVRVTDNLVFGTKKATNATETIPTDQDEVSSFWVEHPNNIFIGNHAAGSEEHGFRFFPNDAPHGASTGQDVPGDFGDLVFRDNTVHSMMNGVFFGGRIDAGTLEIDGPGRQANDAELLLEDTTVYKTIHKRRGGVWAEADNTHIMNLMAVDNGGAVTITRDGYIQDSLIVAESRGNEQDLNFRRAEDQRGLRIYVTADGAVEDVHFEGFNETGEIAFEHSVSNQPNSYAAGFTFADTPDAFRFKWTEGIGQSSTLLDVDGSLTGTPNTLLLPTRSVPGASPQDQFNGFDVPSGNSQTMDELIDDLVKWR